MGGVDFVAAQLQQHGQAVGRVPVVVHDQNATLDRRHGFDARRLSRQGRQRLGKERQAHHELTALTDARAAGFDRAVVHFHQVLHQGQTDAQPVARTLQRRIHLREHLKDAGKLLGGHADAGVLHADDEPAAPSRSTVSRMRPPFSVNLQALFSRLPTT